MKIGSAFYLCQRTSDEGADIITYGNPIKLINQMGNITVQPTGGYTDTLEYGESVSRMWRIVANIDRFSGFFNEGDVCYLDGDAPAINGTNGANATALVTSVRMGNKAIIVMLEKLKG